MLAGLWLACGPAQPPAVQLQDGALAAIERAEDIRRADDPALARALAGAGAAAADVPAEEVSEEATEQDAAVQRQAVRALGRIQDPGSAEVLATVAGGAEGALRRQALFALGQLGLVQGQAPPPAAVGAVEASLTAREPETVAAALAALGKLAPAGAAVQIVPLLEHPQPAVRAAAVMALFRLRYVPQWRGEAAQPPLLPAAATAALAARLADSDPEVRWRAAYSFSRFGESAAVAALLPVLQDDDAWARLFAARALGRSWPLLEGAVPPEAVEALLAALDDPRGAVRLEVVRALAAAGAVERLPLTALAEDPAFPVRAALADALAAAQPGARTEHQAALLVALADDPSPTVRQAVIAARAARAHTAGRPDAELLAELGARVEGDRWPDAVAAVTAAQALGEPGYAVIERALLQADTRVRSAAVAALGKLPDGIDRLAEAVAEPDLAVRGSAVAALTALADPRRLALLDRGYELSAGVEWIEVREAIVAALVSDEDAAAGDLLRRIAESDAAASVRSAAAVALVARGQAVADGGAVAAGAAVVPSPFLPTRITGLPRVVLETVRGDIEIELLPEEAKIHVANFLDLVDKGYYDGLIFHRVVSNFVIQGGDPRGDGWGGPGYALRDEINAVPFLRGTVGMPKAGKDTGGGQLFITHLPTPHLDGNYTVFGRVTRGLEVLEAIDLGDTIVRAYRVEER